jgi:hypothetical protein
MDGGDATHLNSDPTTLSKQECKMFDEVRRRSDREAQALQRLAHNLRYARQLIEGRHEKETYSLRCALHDLTTRTPDLRRRHEDGAKVTGDDVTNRKSSSSSSADDGGSRILKSSSASSKHLAIVTTSASNGAVVVTKVLSPSVSSMPGVAMVTAVHPRGGLHRQMTVTERRQMLKKMREDNACAAEAAKYVRTTTKNYVRRAQSIDRTLQTLYARRVPQP